MATYSSNTTIKWVSSFESFVNGSTFTVPANHFCKGQLFATAIALGAGETIFLAHLRKNNISGNKVLSKSFPGSTGSNSSNISLESSFTLGPGTYYLEVVVGGNVSGTGVVAGLSGNIFTNTPT